MTNMDVTSEASDDIGIKGAVTEIVKICHTVGRMVNDKNESGVTSSPAHINKSIHIVGNLQNIGTRESRVPHTDRNLQSFYISASIAAMVVFVVGLVVCAPRFMKKYAGPVRKKNTNKNSDVPIEWDRDYSQDHYLPRSRIMLDTRFVNDCNVKPNRKSSQKGIKMKGCWSCMKKVDHSKEDRNYSINTLIACLHNNVDQEAVRNLRSTSMISFEMDEMHLKGKVFPTKGNTPSPVDRFGWFRKGVRNYAFDVDDFSDIEGVDNTSNNAITDAVKAENDGNIEGENGSQTLTGNSHSDNYQETARVEVEPENCKSSETKTESFDLQVDRFALAMAKAVMGSLEAEYLRQNHKNHSGSIATSGSDIQRVPSSKAKLIKGDNVFKEFAKSIHSKSLASRVNSNSLDIHVCGDEPKTQTPILRESHKAFRHKMTKHLKWVENEHENKTQREDSREHEHRIQRGNSNVDNKTIYPGKRYLGVQPSEVSAKRSQFRDHGKRQTVFETVELEHECLRHISNANTPVVKDMQGEALSIKEMCADTHFMTVSQHLKESTTESIGDNGGQDKALEVCTPQLSQIDPLNTVPVRVHVPDDTIVDIPNNSEDIPISAEHCSDVHPYQKENINFQSKSVTNKDSGKGAHIGNTQLSSANRGASNDSSQIITSSHDDSREGHLMTTPELNNFLFHNSTSSPGHTQSSHTNFHETHVTVPEFELSDHSDNPMLLSPSNKSEPDGNYRLLELFGDTLQSTDL